MSRECPEHGDRNGCGAAADGNKRRHCCKSAGGGGRGAFVEPAALCALLGQCAHGYDLRRAISEMTGGELAVDTGGLYRVLRRLEDEGFVVSSWSEGDSGPRRRDYRLTAAGRDLAADWVAHLRDRQRMTGHLADAMEKALDECRGKDER